MDRDDASAVYFATQASPCHCPCDHVTRIENQRPDSIYSIEIHSQAAQAGWVLLDGKQDIVTIHPVVRTLDDKVDLSSLTAQTASTPKSRGSPKSIEIEATAVYFDATQNISSDGEKKFSGSKERLRTEYDVDVP